MRNLEWYNVVCIYILSLHHVECMYLNLQPPSLSPPSLPSQARSGEGSTVDVLALFASYSSETSYTVWESLVRSTHMYSGHLINSNLPKSLC